MRRVRRGGPSRSTLVRRVARTRTRREMERVLPDQPASTNLPPGCQTGAIRPREQLRALPLTDRSDPHRQRPPIASYSRSPLLILVGSLSLQAPFSLCCGS